MGIRGGSGLVVAQTEVYSNPAASPKPTLGANVDAIYVETDTGLMFFWDGAEWVPMNQKDYLSVTSTPVTLGPNETIIGVNLAAPVVLTLPSAQAVREGRPYVVKDESGNASAQNITVGTQGAELIDGAATDLINTDFASIGYYANGTNWFKV